jgi:hypothetical protein
VTQTIILWSLAALLVVAGFIGVIAPVLPGAPLVFIGLVLAAWAENFQYVGMWTLIIIAVLLGLTYVVDAIASALGVKKVGASKQAMWGAVIGTTVGVFFGIPGILLRADCAAQFHAGGQGRRGGVDRLRRGDTGKTGHLVCNGGRVRGEAIVLICGRPHTQSSERDTFPSESVVNWTADSNPITQCTTSAPPGGPTCDSSACFLFR